MDRDRYIAETRSGANPGSCMMVPTGAFGRINIGIGHFGWDLNPCNSHLEELAKYVKDGFGSDSPLKANIFSTTGVSDGISMGYDAMRHSLVSRDLAALTLINHVSATPYEGLILIPGCDKNMPASAMALLHLDIPGYIVCGGSIIPGNLDGNEIDIVNSFIATGQLEKGTISEAERMNIVKNACPGSGACGGMYTANSMFTIFEAMGLTTLGSSSTLADNKKDECRDAYKVMENLHKKALTPSNVVNKASFENAVRIISVLGGSTNPILHLLAMAKAGKIDFTEDDFERVSRETPFIGNLMPSGVYRMKELSEAGGTPTVLRYMLENGYLDGNVMTISGRYLGEELENIIYDEDKLLKSGVITSFHEPHLDRGHLVLLRGNIGTGWTKVSGSGIQSYEGSAVVFDSEAEFHEQWGERVKGEGDFVIIRYEGPKSSPGCPEMLKPSTKLAGKFGNQAKIGLMTDGRFSGGSIGGTPIIGHVDEAVDNGLIGIIQNGDKIIVNPGSNEMNLLVDEGEIELRVSGWRLPQKVKARIENAPIDLQHYHHNTSPVRMGASMLFK